MADENLSFKISINADTKQLQSLNRQFSDLQKGLNVLNGALKKGGVGVETYQKKAQLLQKQLQTLKDKQQKCANVIQDYNKRMTDNRAKYEELSKSAGDHSKELIKLDNEYYKMQTSLNRVETEMATLDTQIQTTNSQLQACQITVSKFNQLKLSETFKRWGDNLQNFAEKSKKVGEALKGVGDAGLKAFLPLDTALVGSSKAFLTFEEGLAKVNSIAQQSTEEIKHFSDSILNLSNNSGTDVNELTEATYQAISASVDYKDSVKFVAEANKLAVGGFTDAASAVDILTTTINAYGKSTEETEHLSSVLIKTQNLGKKVLPRILVIRYCNAFKIEKLSLMIC